VVQLKANVTAFDPVRVPGGFDDVELWDHLELQAMMAEINADIASQLTQLREREKRGELAAIHRGRSESSLLASSPPRCMK